MDLWTALRVIRRHPLVLVSGLLLTALVVGGLGMRLQQKYSATGTVIVIAPGGRANPIDIYSSSSPLGASVATTLGNADTTKAEVRAEGGSSDYTLVADPSLPVITITATSASPDTSVRSVGLVAELMNRLLARRQTDFATPVAAQLKVLALTAPGTATITTFKTAVMGVAAGLGLVVVLAAVFIAEGARERRLVRRSQRAADAAGSTGAGPIPGETFADSGTVVPDVPTFEARSRPPDATAQAAAPMQSDADSPLPPVVDQPKLTTPPLVPPDPPDSASEPSELAPVEEQALAAPPSPVESGAPLAQPVPAVATASTATRRVARGVATGPSSRRRSGTK